MSTKEDEPQPIAHRTSRTGPKPTRPSRLHVKTRFADDTEDAKLSRQDTGYETGLSSVGLGADDGNRDLSFWAIPSAPPKDAHLLHKIQSHAETPVPAAVFLATEVSSRSASGYVSEQSSDELTTPPSKAREPERREGDTERYTSVTGRPRAHSRGQRRRVKDMGESEGFADISDRD